MSASRASSRGASAKAAAARPKLSVPPDTLAPTQRATIAATAIPLSMPSWATANAGPGAFNGLKISDIDFAAGQFKVFGKGAKERIVPMGLTTRRAIIRYVEHYRPQPVNLNENRLFLTAAGGAVTARSVQQMIERLAQRADIPRLHAHLLRHIKMPSQLVSECPMTFPQK